MILCIIIEQVGVGPFMYSIAIEITYKENLFVYNSPFMNINHYKVYVDHIHINYHLQDMYPH